jgi:hypothetical protein
MNKKSKKQRRASARLAVREEDARKDAAATVMRGLLFVRRARMMARFFRENPDMIKEGRQGTLAIQKSWRGKQARKRVKSLRGDFVPNASLDDLVATHGGSKGLVEYVRAKMGWRYTHGASSPGEARERGGFGVFPPDNPRAKQPLPPQKDTPCCAR